MIDDQQVEQVSQFKYLEVGYQMMDLLLRTYEQELEWRGCSLSLGLEMVLIPIFIMSRSQEIEGRSRVSSRTESLTSRSSHALTSR